jgi:hypothetical protein
MASTSKQKTGSRGVETARSVDFNALMQANLVRVFGERDADRRRAALRELYAEDATLYEPQAVATGPEAISAAVDALLVSMPPDGPVAVTGTDVAHVEGGRIKSLHVFLDSTPR